jgi:hypothetical protein
MAWKNLFVLLLNQIRLLKYSRVKLAFRQLALCRLLYIFRKLIPNHRVVELNFFAVVKQHAGITKLIQQNVNALA